MNTSADTGKPLWKTILWEAAWLIVAVAALVAIGSRCGLGLFCPGLAPVFAGAVIIETVRRFIKTRHRRGVVSFVLVVLMAVPAVVYVFDYTSPKGLFRDYVAAPMPESVRILHSEYRGGRDPTVYLHFELDPGDLNMILAKRPYKTDAGNHTFGPNPAWWRPESLRNPVLYYWSAGQDTVWLWVNEDQTEAYFTFWNT